MHIANGFVHLYTIMFKPEPFSCNKQNIVSEKYWGIWNTEGRVGICMYSASICYLHVIPIVSNIVLAATANVLCR